MFKIRFVVHKYKCSRCAFRYKKLLVEINGNSERNNAYAFFTRIVVPKSLFYQRHSAFILKNKYYHEHGHSKKRSIQIS